MRESATQIHEHRGPWFDHWRLRVLAAFGGVPLDEQTDRR